MKTYLTKTLVSLMVLTLVVVPLRSRAVFGVGDIVSDFGVIPEEVMQTIGQITQIENEIQMVLKAFGLDVVIYKISQQLSQKLIAKVLNKANGGADGEDSKLFVENFGKYFEDISKKQIGSYTNFLDSSSNPFAQSISMGISNQAGGSQEASKSLLESFSLKSAVPEGVNWQDAVNDISAAGDQGWDFYGQLALPQNSPLGSAIIAQDDLVQQINTAKETAKTELTSSGFKPDKGKSSISSMFEDKGQESFSNVNLDGDIKTPTKTNEEQSAQPVQETFERLRNADSFGKILFNTIQQLVVGLVQKGFSSLTSDGGASSKLYGGPKDLNKVLTSNTLSWSSVPQQVIDLRNSLDVGIEKTKLEIDALERTIDSVKKPVSDTSHFQDGPFNVRGTILSLEVCLPGPDTGYDQRLREYMTEKVKDTQRRSGQDGEKGSKNAEALTIVQREVGQAIIESKALDSNPFLNIPGSTAMKSALVDYYRTGKKFRGLIDSLIIKRRTLNNLQVLRSEAQARGTVANNNVPLILNETQWKNLTTAQKNTLYTSLLPAIQETFPEYLVEENDIKTLVDATSTQTSGITTIKPLPVDDPNTLDINERDDEMKKRVFDEQWNEWEAKVSEKDRQKLYAQYIGLTQDISDSTTVEKAQLAAEGAAEQYKELLDILDDCKSIRTYLRTSPNVGIDDGPFIETLKSSRVRSAYRGPSIVTAAESGVDFDRLNERVVGDLADSMGLQVPNLAENVSDLLSQDREEKLFCRLMKYELFYWAPSQLTGKPIACNRTRPSVTYMFANDTRRDLVATLNVFPDNVTDDAIIAPNGDATSGAMEKIDPDWYHTNNGEILFMVSDN